MANAQRVSTPENSQPAQGVIPAEQHRAITKKARKTNHIERFNNTLRQRVARLVRGFVASFHRREFEVCSPSMTNGGA